MLTIQGVSDPAALVKQIVEDAGKKQDKVAFDKWTVKRVKKDDGVEDQLFHLGSSGDWETKGSFCVKADIKNGEVDFLWRSGSSKDSGDKFSYLHGRLLEQLAAHYAAKGQKVIYRDNRE